MKNFVNCSTVGIRWTEIVRSLLVTRELPDWPQLLGEGAIPCYQARVGLWRLCQHWQLSLGDEVLMPSYNCGTEVDPFISYGLRVSFYRIDLSTRIDLEDLKSRCGPKTRVVYITHYFGWPQEMAPILEWCRERSIQIVEDCALSLFSRGPDGYLGISADAAVFSFRKTLSVPDGGVIVLREHTSDGSNAIIIPPPRSVTLKNLLPFAKSTALRTIVAVGLYPFLRRLKLRSFRFEDCPADVPFPDMPNEYYFDKGMQNWTISPTSLGILSNVDPDHVVAQRRRNFFCLSESIRDIPGMRPLFTTLPEGVCPLGLVLLVDQRTPLCRALNAHGIAAFPWWEGYHRGLDWKGFPEACYLKDHALLLPVSQTMNEHHMVFIAQCLRRIIKEIYVVS